MATQIKVQKKSSKTAFETPSKSLPTPKNGSKPQGRRFSNPIDRFKANRTRKNAIHAECYQCMGGDKNSSWKTDIGNCEIKKCHLWIFRPHQNRYKINTD